MVLINSMMSLMHPTAAASSDLRITAVSLLNRLAGDLAAGSASAVAAPADLPVRPSFV
jgi:hypothetical protein